MEIVSGAATCPKLMKSYFGSPKGTQLGIVTAALFLPAILFSFVGDWLCQRFGRKITVYIGSVLIIIGGIWNAFAQDLGQFAGGKFAILVKEKLDLS